MKSIELNEIIRQQLKKMAEIASFLWERQWAERNGGNISVLLSEEDCQIPSENDSHFPVENWPKTAAGLMFIVTGSGVRLRHIKRPKESLLILKIDDKAEGYYLLWGNRNLKPTSEFITHLKIHLNRLKSGKTGGAVLHTHPTELIALSHHKEYTKDSGKFCTLLWSMLPEVRLFTPRGIGLLDYIIPGSEDLAEATVNSLQSKDVVVWKKHGAIAVGDDVEEAFDFIDVANKGARIFLQCLSAGFIPEGLSPGELEELKQLLKITGNSKT
jgi:rhamnulose-1-phosphate aldolase